MACVKADELPDAQYVERFNEWKKLCNTMNRLDKIVKEYMILNKIDYIEDEGVEKTVNMLTVNVDDEKASAKRARVE
eukprot:jgi/Tetstr1/449755/TSEL_036821.t1